MSQTKDLCHHLIFLTRNQGSHDMENHCGYLTSLVSAEIPFMKTIRDQNLADPKGSDLSKW